MAAVAAQPGRHDVDLRGLGGQHQNDAHCGPDGGDLREELHDLLRVLPVETALHGVRGELVDDDQLDTAQLLQKFLGGLGHPEVDEDLGAPLQLGGQHLQELQEPFGVPADERVEGGGDTDVLAGALPVEEPHPDPGVEHGADEDVRDGHALPGAGRPTDEEAVVGDGGQDDAAALVEPEGQAVAPGVDLVGGADQRVGDGPAERVGHGHPQAELVLAPFVADVHLVAGYTEAAWRAGPPSSAPRRR